MSFQEKTLKCSDCSTNFAFTTGEQQFFQTKGFTEDPRRCPACRAKRKSERQDSAPRAW